VVFLRRFGSGASHENGAVVIEPLTAQEAPRVRTSLFGRFASSELIAAVEANPSLAFVARGENQYALGSHWRRRREIGQITEVSRGPYRRALAERLIDAFRAEGASLVLLDFEEGGSDASFYAELGFRPVDRIIEYERTGCSLLANVREVPIRRLRDDRAEIGDLLEIERESFPWLWWNSRDELSHYLTAGGVEVYLAFDGERPVGYAGITVRGTAAHLDRLAVRSSHQRHGYGAALVAFCLRRLGSLGVRRVTLSTQEDNFRSRALYERLGFRRGRWSYDILGLWLRRPEEIEGITGPTT
jgi:ribosomal protein S18 acetylase RimI-like enzyme